MELYALNTIMAMCVGQLLMLHDILWGIFSDMKFLLPQRQLSNNDAVLKVHCSCHCMI